jgi:16S rRNA (uracil1498-N3)-methyltransferase
MHRFHVPDLPHEGALVALVDEEARHLTQVLRLSLGDDVRAFDGRGREHMARVEVAARNRAEIRVGPQVEAAPEPGVRLTLAAALLKGDKFDDVVRDAAMMGVQAIQPLVTARTEVPSARAGKGSRVDRWRRIALSSVKQCGRAVVPEILEPVPLAEAVSSLPRPMIVLAEPSASTAHSTVAGAPPDAATLLIGPEGGWAPAEVEALAAASASFLQLGGRTLRADAAPLVALSVVLYAWKGL